MNRIIHKIAIWGDSILKGVSWDEGAGKYCVLPQNCSTLLKEDEDYDIHNTSRFGCTIAKGHRIMLSDLNKNGNYDVAFIEFGGNDCDFDWKAIAENPDKEYLPNTPLEHFQTEMQSMIDECRERRVEPVLMTLPPLEPNRFFQTVTQGLNADNVMKWLGDVYHIYRWQEIYSNMIADIACENGCKLVDIRSAFLKDWHYERYICRDGMHPNQDGHRLMYGVLENFLRNKASLQLD